jgi:hypothetical protein
VVFGQVIGVVAELVGVAQQPQALFVGLVERDVARAFQVVEYPKFNTIGRTIH